MWIFDYFSQDFLGTIGSDNVREWSKTACLDLIFKVLSGVVAQFLFRFLRNRGYVVAWIQFEKHTESGNGMDLISLNSQVSLRFFQATADIPMQQGLWNNF